MQPGLHGAQGAIQFHGNLFQTGPGKESQLDDQTMLSGQHRDCISQLPSIVCLFCLMSWGSGHGEDDIEQGIIELRHCALRDLLQAAVPKKSKQPRGEPAATVKSAERPPGSNQHILGQIFGSMMIAAARIGTSQKK